MSDGRLSDKESDASKFERLAEQWEAATGMMSNMTRAMQHPAYQEIIGMGDKVVPFMLNDFKNGQYRHWFSALSQLTQANPVPFEMRGKIKAMAEAWVQWGKEHGYKR